jgi:intracellular sulfur oxidation DsrE/DsrF family protein
MTTSKRRLFGLLGTGTIVALITPRIQAADSRATAAVTKNKVVFQVSDSDPSKWNLALNNLRNIQVDLGDDGSELELVAYGPGIGMLKADSPVANRIVETLKTGAKVVACENTMKGFKLGYADMLQGIGFVPSGVVELMRKQQQGFAYIRP